MGYIPLDSLIADMTPAQKILMQQFYAKYDFGAGQIRRKIINIEPFIYNGLIAGSGLETFINTKVFIAYELKLTGSGSAPPNIASTPYLILSDELDNGMFVMQNVSPVWDITANIMKGQCNDINISNVIFWRIGNQIYNSVYFLGYKITLGTV